MLGEWAFKMSNEIQMSWMKGDKAGQYKNGEASWKHNRKKKRMKRKGKKKSILSDRNQVMGHISYVYVVPYVVCICFLVHRSEFAGATSFFLLK